MELEHHQSSAATEALDDAATINTSNIATPFYRRNMSFDKQSTGSNCCRICHEDEKLEELIDPCKCSGTLGLIHTSCLEKWLSTSNTDHCEICNVSFEIQKSYKPLLQSFREWWRTRKKKGLGGIIGDIMCMIVLTPLCIGAAYFCAIGATPYIKRGVWEGTGLTVLYSSMITTYCLWLIITIRFHYKSWRQWREKNQDVKLIVKHKPEICIIEFSNPENRFTI